MYYNTMSTITKENPQGYKYIFRTDTNNYSDTDIKFEIAEWLRIIGGVLQKMPTFEIREVRHSTRARAFLAKVGHCTATDGYIVINDMYLKTHSNPNNFHSTLAHEVLHSFPGCFNHGIPFKTCGAQIVRKVPHITITRTGLDAGYVEAKKQLKANTEAKSPKPKWIIECQHCGQKIYRERYSKIVKSPSLYRCAICGGKFSVTCL